MNTIFDDADIISSYPLQQAIDDGVLVEIFKDKWEQLSSGKPIVATAHLYNEVNSIEQLAMVWDKFILWCRHVQDTLPEEEQLFTTHVNDKKVWVIEDRQAITMMYPEEY